MSEQNKQVALKFIDAMGKGDKEVFASTLAPDAIAVAKGFAKLSGTRTRDMSVGTAEMFKKLWPTGLNPDIKTVTAEGDRVMVEFEGHALCSNGKRYDNQYVMAFTLKDGKIKQVNEYFCTKLADEVMLPLLAEHGLV